VDVVAMDGLAVIGTIGFFVPAAILIALVIGAVVRDRRLSAQEAAAAEREDLGPEIERITPPRGD
jgi:site-specific recombinase